MTLEKVGSIVSTMVQKNGILIRKTNYAKCNSVLVTITGIEQSCFSAHFKHLRNEYIQGMIENWYKQKQKKINQYSTHAQTVK